MKKRVFLSLVLLIIASAVFASRVFAQTPTPDKLKFADAGKNDYSVKKANDNISGAVVIPGTYSNKPVTLITDSAFTNCKNITSVTIPASVTAIGGKAFAGCEKLTSVTFGGKNTVMVMAGFNVSFPGDLYDVYKAGGAGTYTRTAGGNNWKKGGTTTNAPAPAASLDGNWETDNGNITISISGNTAVLNWAGFNLMEDAVKKGYVKFDDQIFRNIKSAGNLKWTMQELTVTYNTRSPDVATGVRWSNSTYTMSENGQTLSKNGRVVWVRERVFNN